MITAQYKEIQSILTCTVTLDPTSYHLYYDTWTKDPLEPTVTVTDQYGNVLVKDVDYTVEYQNNTINRTYPKIDFDSCRIAYVNRSTTKTANAIITGIGAWRDSVTKTFTITYTDDNTPCVFVRDQKEPSEKYNVSFTAADYDMPGTITFPDGGMAGSYEIRKGVTVGNTYSSGGTKNYTLTDANGTTHKLTIYL